MDNQLNEEVVQAGFVRLIGCMFKFPLPRERYHFSVKNYEMALKPHFTADQYLAAVTLWVEGAKGSGGWWPRTSDLIKVWKEHHSTKFNVEGEFHKLKAIIKSLPGYYGSQLSANQQLAAWDQKIAQAYPGGMPAPIRAALDAVGGWRGIKKKMRSENSFDSSAMERSFVAVAKQSLETSSPKELLQITTQQNQQLRITHG
jgi:hypothetical protein